MEALEKMGKLGYKCVEPYKSDKTYLFIKHTEKTTEQIWVHLKRKPKIEYKKNYVTLAVPEKEEQVLADLISELGFEEYIAIVPSGE